MHLSSLAGPAVLVPRRGGITHRIGNIGNKFFHRAPAPGEAIALGPSIGPFFSLFSLSLISGHVSLVLRVTYLVPMMLCSNPLNLIVSKFRAKVVHTTGYAYVVRQPSYLKKYALPSPLLAHIVQAGPDGDATNDPLKRQWERAPSMVCFLCGRMPC